MTNILWFCVYASMYLWLRSKYKTFINGRLIFTKSCIPILLLNYKNVFLPHFCLLSVKVEAFKHIWESTARFLCFFKKNFSLSLKNYSFQWHEILDTNLDNLISDIGHIDSIESHEKFTFYFAKKNPDMKSSLFWSGYLNTLISYSKSWYQYQNKNIFFTWTLEPC